MNNKSSIYNAISAILFTLINGILGVLVTRLVILNYGSDFNGLNSTANQIVNVLLIFEGGFTIASNVALFKPIAENDYDKINDFLCLTQKKFKKIALTCLILGSLISILYSILINSHLSKELVFSVIFMTVVSTTFNLYYATTYRVLLQSSQKEYIINIIMSVCVGIGHIVNVAIIYYNGSMWLIRFVTMFFSIVSSIFIGIYTKKIYKYINLNKECSTSLQISGTRDVMIQKITGVVYTAVPIVFLSMSPSGGTVLASIYAVYNNVLNMIKSLLRGIIDAPRHGIGILVSKNGKEDVWNVYFYYEYITICAIFVTLVTTYVLIMPFIKLYTVGIQDAKYYDKSIAMLMIIIAFFELIHIPSGHLMNMSGQFKIGKRFQIIACISLIICMPIGLLLNGVYGLLVAILLAAILLAVLEIGYVHCYYFKNKCFIFLFLLVPFTIIGVIACYVESLIFHHIEGICQFILNGVVITCINSILTIFISLILYKREFKTVCKKIIKRLK